MKKILFLGFALSCLLVNPIIAKKDNCLNAYSVAVSTAQLTYDNEVRSIGESFLTGGRNIGSWYVNYRDLERARVEFYFALDVAAVELCGCDQAWCE
jgi:hypothetical protein